jgi:Zn ribbon nucleic-acid-binding protein
VTQHVECLRCGEVRPVERTAWQHDEPGECLRCGYVGWALPGELRESERRLLRMRPPELRRLQLL